VISTSRGYRLLARAALGIIPLVAPFNSKLSRGHHGRRGALKRLSAWATTRDRSRPLVWFHAPSVGEGLQARAVLDRLRRRRPEWQVVYTHFSPSAETFSQRIGADAADYIPYDTPDTVRASLSLLEPSAVIFTKLDVWPELSTQAAGRGIPVGLIAGTVSPVSGRSRWPSRALIRPGYRALTAAGAISSEDAARLVALGVNRDRITVTGDPRFDSVLDVIERIASDDPVLASAAGAPALVAGSTWPADEAIVLTAFQAVRQSHPEARVMLAPHEPSPAHLEKAEAFARRLGLPPPVRFSSGRKGPLVLIDQVGVLARLYGAGRLGYVGGGFGRAGLHSVLEPAAWGLPVIHGPRWQSSREAGLLQAAGGGFALPGRRQDAVTRLAELWQRWLSEEPARREAGARARSVVEGGAGAAERNADLVERMLP
jgi:3-deoxy-D-manno-octulosonic-acid transferase